MSIARSTSISAASGRCRRATCRTACLRTFTFRHWSVATTISALVVSAGGSSSTTRVAASIAAEARSVSSTVRKSVSDHSTAGERNAAVSCASRITVSVLSGSSASGASQGSRPSTSTAASRCHRSWVSSSTNLARAWE